MRLSARARYAVRLVLEVARLGGQHKPAQLSEVSQWTGISRKFLEQLAIALKRHSVLHGVCGRRGGYMLARPPGKITIGQVMSAVVGPVRVATCVADPPVCMSTEFCVCNLLWTLLQLKLEMALHEFTIGDLLHEHSLDRMRDRVARERARRSARLGVTAIGTESTGLPSTPTAKRRTGSRT